MDWKIFFATFGTVFLAEMGDKTQLAAMTMTIATRTPVTVLAGACLALFLATLLGVLLGSFIANFIPASLLKKAAGAVFIIIGLTMLLARE